ncbi:methyltransferase domain-containing protein [Pseudomonas helleri]|uniref:Methyltransferase domain-containing protein n=1 Tax=Pseudomonas helleri TaxID=1608996 RepID=A0A6A7YQR2_9PSED|nr:class I SAM-dependent methyltransferase [Pseudomonas helleri]MQT33802.1 methyltransferase domain-containing protein [Pseudomonas helleri]MQT49532.1 methyltransferase domain-containing protein [Pseudomonas helleri]MQT91303.1 methyltransferase domain-containing protein [Pseudomonas helleri]
MSDTTSPRPQNVYDDPVFFEGYKNLRQKDSGLNGVLEIPAFHALLPKLQGLKVLDLGAGFGDFARYARSQGAQAVTAVDISQKMLSEARHLTHDDKIVYVHHPIESFTPQAQAFDLVVSSLALHYVDDYAAVVKRVYASLVPGGQFVFSVEHPLCTAQPSGWVLSSEGERLHWPLDNYHYETERQSRWFVENVTKFHRTLQTYVNTLIAADFRLDHLGEPTPLPHALKERSSLTDALRRPPFLLLAVSKPDVS